jgi:hypothetical protein
VKGVGRREGGGERGRVAGIQRGTQKWGEGGGRGRYGDGGEGGELESQSPNNTLMSLVAQSGAGALELQLVTVGISTSTRPGPSWYAVLECTCNLVCISSCVHFTLCSHTLLSQVASAVTTTAPRPRHGLEDVSRQVLQRNSSSIGRYFA